MEAINDLREGFAYSVPISDPLLEYCFSLYSLSEDDLTVETLPDDEEIIEDTGNAIIVMKSSNFLVERGDPVQLHQGIASLRQRLFNEGSPMTVQWRSLRLRYGVNERCIERYLMRVAWHIFRLMSGEWDSHRQSIVFRSTFSCTFSVADLEVLWLNREAQFLLDSTESAVFKTHPATQEAVDGLEKTEIGEGSSFDCRDCAICLEELASNSEHIRMPCKHVYHKDCIIAWLKTSHICPLCRFSLPRE